MSPQTPRRGLLVSLVAANAVLFAFLLLGQPAARLPAPPVPARAGGSRAAGLGSSVEPAKTSEVDLVRDRLVAKLRTACLLRFEQSLQAMDPLIRIAHVATRERIAMDYADLFQGLRLRAEQTALLKELLAQRANSATFFVSLSADVVAAGVPTSYEFGGDYASERIRERFGAAVLAQVEAYEVEIPLRKETAELAIALELARAPLRPSQVDRLKELLRTQPVPDLPPNSASAEEREAYYAQRLERLDEIVAESQRQFGAAASAALADYLLENEECLLSTGAALDRMAQFRRRRAERLRGG